MVRNLGRLAIIGAGLYAARRYFRNWGTTKEESQLALLGDELVADPAVQTTEAVWINAPASAVWPWLVQMGQDRGGLYSYEAVENLVGLRLRNADRIHPEWQQLNVGDNVRLAPSGWMGLRNGVVLRVQQVIPGQVIVLRSSPQHLPSDAVWSFHIKPHWEDRCRLFVRRRTAIRHFGEVLGLEVATPLTALMTRGMLLGIKRRAEAQREAELGRDSGGRAPSMPRNGNRAS